MYASSRLSSFLSLHPRLVQLLTVTPVGRTPDGERAASASTSAYGAEALEATTSLLPSPHKHADTAPRTRAEHGRRDGAGVKATRRKSGSEETAEVPHDFDAEHMSEVISSLRSYADKCDGNTRRRQVYEAEEQATIEDIRVLAQIAVWCDQNDHTLWDVFMHEEAMRQLARVVELTTSPDVKRQCLQSLSIMVQSFKNDMSLYNIFSRSYINHIIASKIDCSDLEMVGHMVSIIRGITNKLDCNLVQFFFDEQKDTFPLFDQAVNLFDHRESMFRIAVRNVTLSIFSLGDQRVLDCVTRNAHSPDHFFNRIFAFANELMAILRRAFVRSAGVALPNSVLVGVADYLGEMESVMEYVNEAVGTNEVSIGAFLGGASIREFVQPPLFELAEFSHGQKGVHKNQFLSHKLVGQALAVEVLSAFSENGKTPCQGLETLAATSTDERAVHMALCAMEALIAYPLCEYDDLVAAGCALPGFKDQGGGVKHVLDQDDEHDVHLLTEAALGNSGSLIRHRSSSLSGYDLLTGNQVLTTASSMTLSEDDKDEDDARLLSGVAPFREMLGSIFRWERSTRSLRVVQAAVRVLLTNFHAGNEEVKRECIAVSAVLLMEYICLIRNLLEDDPNTCWHFLDALMSYSDMRALKKPVELRSVLLNPEIVRNHSFLYPTTTPTERAIKAEMSWRLKRRRGCFDKGPGSQANRMDSVEEAFAKQDAACVLCLAWLSAELNNHGNILRMLESELREVQDKPKETSQDVSEMIARFLQIAGSACAQPEPPVPETTPEKSDDGEKSALEGRGLCDAGNSCDEGHHVDESDGDQLDTDDYSYIPPSPSM